MKSFFWVAVLVCVPLFAVNSTARVKEAGHTGSCDILFKTVGGFPLSRSGLSQAEIRDLLGKSENPSNRFVVVRSQVASRADWSAGQKAAVLTDAFKVIAKEAPTHMGWEFDRYRTPDGDIVFESAKSFSGLYKLLVIRASDGKVFITTRERGNSRSLWRADFTIMEEVVPHLPH